MGVTYERLYFKKTSYFPRLPLSERIQKRAIITQREALKISFLSRTITLPNHKSRFILCLFLGKGPAMESDIQRKEISSDEPLYAYSFSVPAYKS